jgi:hypothetical protein
MTEDLIARLGELRRYLLDVRALVAAEADREAQDGDALADLDIHIRTAEDAKEALQAARR